MNIYSAGDRLVNNLNGETCFISRLKEQEVNGYFSTMHSLVYKVLRRGNAYRNRENLQEKLSGQLMFNNIRAALTNVLGYTPSNKQVLDYYYNLRTHQNYGTNINLLHNGNSLLETYQEIKNDTMDWEESMQLATWYLKEDIVHSIEKFNFNNVVLLRPELLNQERNKNARDFFLALCEWSERHTDWNIYLITKEESVYRYQDGKFKALNNNNLQGICQRQVPFLI